MSWFSAPNRNVHRSVVLCLAAILLGCSSGNRTTVNGVLAWITNPPPGATYPTAPAITVAGRDAEEFPVSEDTTVNSGTGVLQIHISNMPSGETVIFKITGGAGTVDNAITWPYLVGGGKDLIFPVLPFGSMDAVILSATSPGGVILSGGQIDKNKAIIIGALSPPKLASGTCTYSGVDLVSKATGTTVLNPVTNGPFYFTDQGKVVAGIMSDALCSYVIFNVLPGAYYLNLPTANPPRQTEIVALGGEVTMGYGVPGE